MTKQILLPKRTDILVLLDNGHGKKTKGKRSPVWGDGSQLFEYEFNRSIVALISQDLNALNISYTILVKSDDDIPLMQRVRFINTIKGNKVFGISVHSNAGRGEGCEFFTSPGETLSDKMATILGEEFKKEFPYNKHRTDFASDGDSDKEAKFTMLTKTRMPFILTENFFMDNELECKKILMTQDGRRRIAKFHVNAIIRIINELF